MKVTIKDIAQAAGVSTSTVSRALTNKGYVKQDTLEKITEAANKLGYRPNALARSLVRKKSNTIGLIIPEINNPYYSEIISGVEKSTTKNGYTIILVSGFTHSGEDEVKILLERQVDGIIHAGVYKTNTAVAKLKNEGFPIVLLGRKLPNVDTDCVVVNDVDAGYKITKHLIDLGHSCIGYIYGTDISTGSSEKLKGYKKALEEVGQPFCPELVEKGLLEFNGGYEAASKLLSNNPRLTAIVAGNDMMALGARQAINGAKLRIPEDIALVGFDDIFISSLEGIDLTTIAVPREKMGIIGTEMLIKKIENLEEIDQVNQVILESKLVIRKSCGYNK